MARSGLSSMALCALLACAPGAWASPQDAQDKPQDANEKKAETPAKRFHERVEVVAPAVVEGDHVTPFGTQVSTVSSRQVEDLNAGDLASALRRVPGVSISRYDVVGSYGGGDGGAVYVRGQGSGRPGAEITTSIDGIPRFVAVWTHPLLDLMETDAADRIDVYKSAQPVLFGNMAFAGVDVVPKRVTEQGMTTRLLGTFGSYTTLGGVVENGARLGDLDYYVVASQRRSDGHRANADGSVRSLYGRIGYEVAPGWNLNLQVHADDSWAHDPGAIGSPVPAVTPRFAVDDTLSIATLAEEHGDHSGELKVYHDGGSIDWLQWDGSTAQPFTTYTDYSSYGLHARESFHLQGLTDLVVGFDHDRYGGSSTESRSTGDSVFPELEMRDDALYAMVARTFGGATEITPSAGVRYTDSRDFGGRWGVQAGLVVRHGDTEVHANAARAFNLPGVWTAAMYSGWNRGDQWKDLEPEIIDHVEVGIGRQLSGVARVELTVFHDHVTNALRFVPPPPPPPLFANIGAYTVTGAEATVSARPDEAITVFAGVTYLDPSPGDVPNSPHFSVVGGASWAVSSRTVLHADAEWVDRQTALNPRYASTQAWISSYFLLNAKVSYRLGSWTGAVSDVFIAGENVTDSSYEYRPGYPAPGVAVTGGVNVRF